MREGRQLVRDTKLFATEQRARSWWNLVPTVAIFAAVITVACADLPWGIRLLASVIAGLVHVRLFVMFHDYAHGTIFRGSRLADAFFTLYGLVSLSPTSVWKHTHDHHHVNNARRFGVDSVGTFPVLTTHAYREADRRTQLYYAFSRHPLNIAMAYVTVFFYSLCVVPAIADPKKHWDAILAIALHAALVVAGVIFCPDVLLFALVLPTVIAAMLGAYLFYAQHNYPGVKLRADDEWDYVEAALRSSSFTRMSPLMHWFTANIGYHHVHHLNAHIPFYRLPEAMAAIHELQNPVETSLLPTDIIRCLRLDLWDPEKDRLVSFAEARRSEPVASGVE